MTMPIANHDKTTHASSCLLLITSSSQPEPASQASNRRFNDFIILIP